MRGVRREVDVFCTVYAHIDVALSPAQDRVAFNADTIIIKIPIGPECAGERKAALLRTYQN